MSEERRDGEPGDLGPVAGVLADFTVVPDEQLAGRVRRAINRHVLLADALELSFDVLVRTTWDHLRTVIESFPGTTAARDESGEKRRDD